MCSKNILYCPVGYFTGNCTKGLRNPYDIFKVSINFIKVSKHS